MSSSRGEVTERFRTFADEQARGSSPAYERLARAFAVDDRSLTLLATLSRREQQPNLLFGVLRQYKVDVLDPEAALEWLHGNESIVRHELATRRTQTNEAARCAVLLPALALLPQPLALVEIGASAGLCLLYDRYRYAYDVDGRHHVVGPPDSPVCLPCKASAAVPLPDEVPHIGWRVGLDLHPIDVARADNRQWLECLVFPEHTERAARLEAALDLAAADPPRVVAGSFVTDLPALLDEAPAGHTLVVTHSAALGYADEAQREGVRAAVADRNGHLLGLEGNGVMGHTMPDRLTGMVHLDGRLLALADMHGRSLEWSTE
jgi:hypothetical protein